MVLIGPGMTHSDNDNERDCSYSPARADLRGAKVSGKMPRVGPHMRAVLSYVAQHEGCSILACTAYSTARGGHQWTYRAAHRCLDAGLIRDLGTRPGARYALAITDRGLAVLGGA